MLALLVQLQAACTAADDLAQALEGHPGPLRTALDAALRWEQLRLGLFHPNYQEARADPIAYLPLFELLGPCHQMPRKSPGSCSKNLWRQTMTWCHLPCVDDLVPHPRVVSSCQLPPLELSPDLFGKEVMVVASGEESAPKVKASEPVRTRLQQAGDAALLVARLCQAAYYVVKAWLD
jgi:hypothetical protein